MQVQSYSNIFNINYFKIYTRNNEYEIVINDMKLFFKSDPFFEFCTSIPGYFGEYKLKNKDVVVDAGAYVGTFAIFAAKFVGENGKVFAFEPNEKNTEEFRRNIKRNKITNITLIQKALWSENKELIFIDSGDKGILIESKNRLNNEKSKPIIATSIDDFVKKRSLKRIDFIKMDIEGAEIEVLKGAEKALRKF